MSIDKTVQSILESFNKEEGNNITIYNTFNFFNDNNGFNESCQDDLLENNNKFEFTEKQVRKILVLLENAVFQRGEHSEEDRRYLGDMLDEMIWSIADTLNLDTNDSYIDIKTLETRKY